MFSKLKLFSFPGVGFPLPPHFFIVRRIICLFVCLFPVPPPAGCRAPLWGPYSRADFLEQSLDVTVLHNISISQSQSECNNLHFTINSLTLVLHGFDDDDDEPDEGGADVALEAAVQEVHAAAAAGALLAARNGLVDDRGQFAVFNSPN